MCLILNVSLKEKAGPLVAVYGGLSAIYHSFCHYFKLVAAKERAGHSGGLTKIWIDI